jgi:hypothetical protein
LDLQRITGGISKTLESAQATIEGRARRSAIPAYILENEHETK